MDIKPAMVKELRERTGAGMMDCKKALAEAGGDLAAAEEWLRKNAKGKMDKRTERPAGEGRVAIAISDDGRNAAIVELRAETDFTAKNDKFLNMAEKVGQYALKQSAGAITLDDTITKLVDDVRLTSSVDGEARQDGTTADMVFGIGELIAHASAAFTLLPGDVILTMGAGLIGNLVVNVTLGKWFVERRGRAVAIAAMGVSLGGILLPPLSTWLVDVLGWRAAWHVLGVTAALLILPAGLVVRRSPEDYAMFPDGKTAEQMSSADGDAARLDYASSLTRRQAMRTARFYWLVLAFGLFQISITVMLLQTIPFMTDAGYSRLVAASMISLTSVPAFLSKPFWGYYIDRFSAKSLAALGAAITGGALILIVFSVQARLDMLAYFGFLLMGLGWGGLIPLQEVIWASFFGRRYLGAVRSTAMPFSFAMSAAGPVLAAWHYDRFGNYDNAFLLMAVCNLASAVLMLVISDKRPVFNAPPG